MFTYSKFVVIISGGTRRLFWGLTVMQLCPWKRRWLVV